MQNNFKEKMMIHIRKKDGTEIVLNRITYEYGTKPDPRIILYGPEGGYDAKLLLQDLQSGRIELIKQMYRTEGDKWND